MSALPFEERLTPPAIALLVAWLTPMLVRGVARVLSRAPAERHAVLAGSAPGSFVACAMLAWGASGPSTSSQPGSLLDLALVAACALILGWQLRVLRSDDEWRNLRALAPAYGLGVFASIVVCALVAVGARLADVEDAADASESSAWWGVRIDPWDAEAVLALGWAAERREDRELARARMELAEQAGVSRSESLTLAAAIAARDDCERARELFDLALESRAAEAIGSGTSLTLGGYYLPESLVSRCELSEATRGDHE